MMNRIVSLCCIGLLLLGCNSMKKNQPMKEKESDIYLLVGTYSSPDEEGIHVLRFNEESGKASYVSGLKGISNPSYLTVAQQGAFVYAVSEEDAEKASANALSFDEEAGVLRILNSQKTEGGAPCYINIDKDSHFVVTANYSGGSISVFPITNEGTLAPPSQVIAFSGSGPDKKRQEQAHLHCVAFSPEGDFLFANDLGTDKIYKFSVEYEENKIHFLMEGVPSSFAMEPGSGPRHLCFHPGGRFAYLISELSGMVTAFRYDKGELSSFQSIASDTVGARGSADIHISPDGKFLYASNRLKADGIAIFGIDSLEGKLTKAGYQETAVHPRNFIISPNGNYLLVACRDSNIIQVFSIDKITGLLTNTGKNIELKKPVCLKFIK